MNVRGLVQRFKSRGRPRLQRYDFFCKRQRLLTSLSRFILMRLVEEPFFDNSWVPTCVANWQPRT